MWTLMLLLVIHDGEPQKTRMSHHPTRTACALAAHAERVKAPPPGTTVRVFWCQEEAPRT